MKKILWLPIVLISLSLGATPEQQKNTSTKDLCTVHFKVLTHCQTISPNKPALFPSGTITMSCTDALNYFKQRLHGFNKQFTYKDIMSVSTPCNTQLSTVTVLETCDLETHDPFFGKFNIFSNCHKTRNISYAQAAKLLQQKVDFYNDSAAGFIPTRDRINSK